MCSYTRTHARSCVWVCVWSITIFITRTAAIILILLMITKIILGIIKSTMMIIWTNDNTKRLLYFNWLLFLSFSPYQSDDINFSVFTTLLGRFQHGAERKTQPRCLRSHTAFPFRDWRAIHNARYQGPPDACSNLPKMPSSNSGSKHIISSDDDKGNKNLRNVAKCSV